MTWPRDAPSGYVAEAPVGRRLPRFRPPAPAPV